MKARACWQSVPDDHLQAGDPICNSTSHTHACSSTCMHTSITHRRVRRTHATSKEPLSAQGRCAHKRTTRRCEHAGPATTNWSQTSLQQRPPSIKSPRCWHTAGTLLAHGWHTAGTRLTHG